MSRGAVAFARGEPDSALRRGYRGARRPAAVM